MVAASDRFTQPHHGVRFEWGATGATTLAPDSACLVIVDVLSFTTSVTVAVEAGTRVFPYPWPDDTAVGFADEKQAALAVGRTAANAASPWSLSPAALRRAPFTPRLVLPSPNGSAIAAAADGVAVVAGCLRNAAATGRWLSQQGWGTVERPVAVIAAGERWPDNTLRPALEDLLGAGAIIAALHEHHAGPLSPEAFAAQACYHATHDVASMVASCSSGQELTHGGFVDDITIASEINVCDTVAVLTDAAFTAADEADGASYDYLGTHLCQEDG